MSCPPGFAETARTLGEIDCTNTAPFVSVRAPTALADSTMPVVEAFFVLAAIAALVHAVLWWRRRGDPSNLGLWCATLVYLLVLEPPLYFPERFGLQDQLGLIFVHNVFSVQFLQDRLPLYIVAIYPALTYAAYALVQRTGLLDRHGPVAGAACVAVVFHCCYEIFDQLGPHLRWWAWNPDAPTNTPWLAAVPVSSVVIFAAASPFGMVLLTRLLLARRSHTTASMVLRVVAVGVLTPFAMMICSLPYGLVPSRFPIAQAIALWVVLAVFVVLTIGTVRRAGRPREEPAPGFLGGYPVVAGWAFLAVFAGLWAVALPDYLAATDGRTPVGTPIGSLGYAAACALVVAAFLGYAVSGHPARTRRRRPAPLRR
ncbi:hypothetical protein [Actinoplanes sp. NPDC051859]|uniref:DUF7802 domain-containing protein n=1 Tax=Actinoplanes sp. NPDC051859 TaxID=3363909 RepID=UPI0037B499B4